MLVYTFQVLIVQVSKAMFAVTNPGIVLYPSDRMKILSLKHSLQPVESERTWGLELNCEVQGQPCLQCP